jgi:hypothetical protein
VKKILAVLLLVALIPLSASCTWFKKEEPVIAAALNCAEAKLSSDAGALVTPLIELLMTAGEGWEAAVAALGPVGKDIMTCAEQAAEKQLVATAPPPPVGTAAPTAMVSPAEGRRQLALVRVRYLLSKGKTVAK